MCIKYEIYWLDFIIAQVANWVSVFKTTFQQIDKCKTKRIKQLKIIVAIKTSNLAMEEKIKNKELELKNLNTSYISNTGANILDNIKVELLFQQMSFDRNTSGTTS